MRYLNKIIFLNSAHIPYTEVKLDGNVHFIGTQGVGKSTLLRAILFFYNADKLKLGIPKEKKGFDTFYFPYPNSYIVYEVMRPEGAFCVVAAKSQGRTMFRFIDAAYDRNWFVNENGEVPGEWKRINERIGKSCYTSPLVEYYDKYRDIIYGNNQRKELRDYARFYLFESSQYQNIPRTIQNVFLNSKLDADFIKDTIIHSMNNDEFTIKLDFYRHQIKEFEQEYTDVKRWSERKRNGEIAVRKTAAEVIDCYYDLLHTKKNIKVKRCELHFAANTARQRLPQLQKDLSQNKNIQSQIEEQIEREKELYKQQHEELIRRLGILDNHLTTIEKKRKAYEELHIQDLIQRVQQENVLKEDLQNRQHEREQLTREQQNIVEKYRTLAEKAQHDFERFKIEKQSLSDKRSFESAAAEKELLKHRYEQEERIREYSEKELSRLSEERKNLQERLNNLKQRRLHLQYNPPFQTEMENCKRLMTELDAACTKRSAEIRECQQEIQHVRKESEFAVAQLRQKFEHELEKTEALCQENRKKTEDTVLKLEQHKDSLSAWLEKNKPDWKQNIGKVVNEDLVLYANNLTPRLTENSGSTSIYGIELDLSALECNVLSPEDLRRKKMELEKQAELYEQHKLGLRQQLETDTETAQRPFAEKVNQWLDKQHQLEQEQKQEPAERNALKAELIGWEKKQEQHLTEKNQKLDEEENSLHQQQIAVENGEKTIREADQTKINTCRTDYQKELEKLQNDLLNYRRQIEKDISERQTTLNCQKEELKKAEQEELKGNGVDMAFLAQIDEAIKKLNDEIEFIQENRKHVLRYDNDKAEWFDHETDFKLEKEQLEEKSTQLDKQHDETAQSLSEQEQEIKKTLQKLNEEQRRTNEELSTVRKFQSDTYLCPQTEEIYEPLETQHSCQDLVTQLTSLIASSLSKEDKFRKNIHAFNGYFSPKNTFHFNQNLVEEKDFYDFAANLSDFVENDVISDFEKQISNRYINIMRNLAHEIAQLTNHEYEIDKIITAINHDFVERNFAGVIKQIALRTQPGSDKLVQLLIEIKRFYDENEYNLGETDLFNQDSKDGAHTKAVKYLLAFAKQLVDNPQRQELTLSDTFKLEFRIKENDNDTGWTEKIANVGSDGTDILVKSMVNIMLINVFKEKASRKKQDFRVHCMMDEIGKLHPTNVKGILEFANCRNILLVNCSPTSFNAGDYKYTYLLRKDSRANTSVIPLLAKQDQASQNAE